ncbi:Cax4p [Saccharomyces cerevisiae YJM1388]|nr:Cax4p [Saccharomyces cerevisiae YJM1592]AJS27332.1 Cax4p [Saccharomyces cerevisiae YJM1388]AJS27824.1 Cax4p [Saccharomyces cerevisiae YJM1389]CAI4497642.1 CEL_1a_G0020710.mRNA.1.CDS.1 [Saccharomyces cerevisiae]CAI6682600.1 AKR_collapsed_G0020910.mRNA.1.CDS.1 [Saccharomyces cerevisiae]
MNSTAAAINPNPNVIPFDDTYILYDSHDFLSFLSAYFSLMPILVLAFYLSWFIITRELEACIVAFGQLMNEIFNNVIKNIIKQPRPVSFGASFQNDTIRSGYGMPSAHSQFMGFCFTYNSLKIYTSWKNLNFLEKCIFSGALALLSFCVCFSRVYLHYHNLDQVIVGFSVGALTGSLYFFIVGIIRELGLINWFLKLRIVRLFYMTDSYNLAPLTLKANYEAYWKRINQRSFNDKSKRD